MFLTKMYNNTSLFYTQYSDSYPSDTVQYYDNSAPIVGKLDTNEYKEHSYSHRGNAENFSPVGMI